MEYGEKMTEVDLLVLGGLVVTGADGPVYSPGYVAVGNGVVVDVGKAKPSGYTAQKTVDASGMIILPGLVSAHDHMYGVLAHGIPVKSQLKDFWDFLKNFWWPYVEDRLDKNLAEAAVHYAAAERLRTGTTCVADILEAPNALPNVLETEARAVESLGLRAVLSFEATERMSPENGIQGLEENKRFIEKMNTRPRLVKGMHCLHTTFTCSPDFIRRCRADADMTKAGIHIHFEEGSYETQQALKKYGKYPAQLYEELGFWRDDVLASQCVKTTSDELNILAKYDVKISHQPLSNGEVGGGIAPVPEMLQRGLTVCLGTDGFIVDMFEVMRNTWLIHKAAKENAGVMPAETVFRMATENGAKTLGYRGGRIEKGYKADLVLLQNKFPTPVTPENVLTQVVVYASGSWVDTVIVDGKVVVEKGRLATGDEENIRQKCFKAAEKLWEGL
ncbi:N-ethylammeline chlorohydrolase [Candidatus Caldarchaeum subterraneum]|uniref:N-ethylammeline chlorohydrolase n=2 Tax=Caldiarchaeum subterraneum TaxID=311458 RepID=E6P8H8_CALS0|nr:N-ethylammeline chlorohydrolase [Candidatus Caldarchaeum subterraneum]